MSMPKKMPLRLKKYINTTRKSPPPTDDKKEEECVFPYETLHNYHLTNYNIKNPEIYGVYFICCIGNYQTIVREQMLCIERSGLFHKTNQIYCFICQFKEDVMELLQPYMSKLTIIPTTENLYEKFALSNIWNYISTEMPFYLYYFHTKGVSRSKQVFHDRRQNLNFFILEKHEACLFWLRNGYDAVGTALSLYPTLHFSGNFWWTTSDHLKKLPKEIRDTYYAPEMYICSCPEDKYISVCQTTNDKKRSNYESLQLDDILKQSTITPIKNIGSIDIPY